MLCDLQSENGVWNHLIGVWFLALRYGFDEKLGFSGLSFLVCKVAIKTASYRILARLT